MNWLAILLIGLIIGFVLELILDLLFFRGRRICSVSSDRVTSLVEQNTNLDRENARLQASLDVAENELSRFRNLNLVGDRGGDSNGNAATMLALVDSRNQENSQLRENLAAQAANVTALNSQVQMRQDENSQLRERMAVVAAQLEASQKEVNRLNLALANANEKLADCWASKSNNPQTDISSLMAMVTGAISQSSRGNVTVHVTGSDWQQPSITSTSTDVADSPGDESDPTSVPPNGPKVNKQPDPNPTVTVANRPFEGGLDVEKPISYELIKVTGIGRKAAEKLAGLGITTYSELCSAVENKDIRVWQALTEGTPAPWVRRQQNEKWKTADDFFNDENVSKFWKDHICGMVSGNFGIGKAKLDEIWIHPPNENFDNFCGITEGIEDELYEAGISSWQALEEANSESVKEILTKTEGRKERFQRVYQSDDWEKWFEHISAQAGILAGGDKGMYRRLKIYQLEHCGKDLDKICGVNAGMCEGLGVAIAGLQRADARQMREWWSDYQDALFKEYSILLAGLANEGDKWAKLADQINMQAKWIYEGDWISLYEYQRNNCGKSTSIAFETLVQGWTWKGDASRSYEENKRIYDEYIVEYRTEISSLSYEERVSWLISKGFIGPDGVGVESTNGESA